MSDDIVARLREMCGNELWGDAADEIERLRADAAFLRGELDTSRMRFRDLMIRHGEMEAEMRERNNKLLHRLQEYEAREAK